MEDNKNYLVKSSIEQYTKEQLDLIKNTVAKGATNDELKLFLYRAQNLGLDPLKPGQIHFIKYGGGSGTIVVGIDGFRARAQGTGKLVGIKRGAIKENGKLVGGWAEVYRADWKEPAREEVPLSEYNTGKGPWLKMPETMIKKVAECAALRMAFPDELGGIYAPEEMDQANSEKNSSVSSREPAPKQVDQSVAKETIQDFLDVIKAAEKKYGNDFYKKYLVNDKGESPTVDQILKWKSERQIAWLRKGVDQMTQDLIYSDEVNDLPDWTDADVEVPNG